MTIFNVPVTVQIEADSEKEAAQKVLAYMEYAQDVGNDDNAVKAAFIGTEAEVRRVVI